MNAIAFLQASTDFAHRTYEQTVAGLTAAQANHPPLGLAGTVGSCMAHVVFVEDTLIQAVLRGVPKLHSSEFAGRTGISDPQMFNTEKWRVSVRAYPESLGAYAGAVFRATDQYLASLTDSDLDATRDMSAAGLGTRTVGWMLANLVIAHLNNLTGEISALKGAQGLTGYPF